jgi:hypothetical protein
VALGSPIRCSNISPLAKGTFARIAVVFEVLAAALLVYIVAAVIVTHDWCEFSSTRSSRILNSTRRTSHSRLRLAL